MNPQSETSQHCRRHELTTDAPNPDNINVFFSAVLGARCRWAGTVLCDDAHGPLSSSIQHNRHLIDVLLSPNSWDKTKNLTFCGYCLLAICLQCCPPIKSLQIQSNFDIVNICNHGSFDRFYDSHNAHSSSREMELR